MKLHVDRRIILNLAETARSLGVSKTTVRNWIDDGAPGKKAGRDWEIHLPDYYEWRQDCAIDRRRGGDGKLDFSYKPEDDDPLWPGEIDLNELREAASSLANNKPEVADWLARLADFLDPEKTNFGFR